MEWNTIETKVLCFRCDIEHMSLKASTTFIAFMFSVLSNMLVSSACAYAYVMCIVYCALCECETLEAYRPTSHPCG